MPPHDDPPIAVPHEAPPPPRSRGVGVTLTVSVVVLAIVLAVGFFLVQRHKAALADELQSQTLTDVSTPPAVNVVSVKTAPSTQFLILPGTTRGWYQSTIYARVSGYVADWKADIGDSVKKNQLLATIDTPDLDAQLSAAQHQLAISQSEVDVAQATADFDKSTYERWRDSPKGVVSDQEREEKRADYEGGVAKLKAAGSKVSYDQAQVDGLTALSGFKRVLAPFDAVITARHIDIGDLVTAGSTSNTSSLYDLAQIDKMRIFIDVPQIEAAGMKVGAEADAIANDYPDRKFHGEISRTSDAIDPQTRTLRVEVDVHNPDLLLKPGMYVQVTFDLPQSGMLEVPASAMMFPSTGPTVAVVSGDSRVHFHSVSIAQDNGDFVELGSGVSSGEKVALNLSNQIADGDQVTATDVDRPTTAANAEPTGQKTASLSDAPQ